LLCHAVPVETLRIPGSMDVSVYLHSEAFLSLTIVSETSDASQKRRLPAAKQLTASASRPLRIASCLASSSSAATTRP
jgi:hypothetical protein